MSKTFVSEARGFVVFQRPEVQDKGRQLAYR